jgi:hypothetical protein
MRGGESSSMNVRREKSKLGKEEMEMVSVIKEKYRDKKKGAGLDMSSVCAEGGRYLEIEVSNKI